MKKKNPYQYKTPKKKQGEKKFYQALIKMLDKDKEEDDKPIQD
jgi:hypothetical protein